MPFTQTSGYCAPSGVCSLGAVGGALNGFVLIGEESGDYSGYSVTAVGDINGDGLDDLAIGAERADTAGSGSGKTYVIFGSNTVHAWSAGSYLLNALADGVRGFILNGEAAFDHSGTSISGGGDINHDGLSDLIIGADQYSGGHGRGKTYVIFGSNEPGAWSLGTLQLGDLLDGVRGFVLTGAGAQDASGTSVAFLGDVNADGIDDLIVGAPQASSAGKSYVVFGSNETNAWSAGTYSLGVLADGVRGFVLTGEANGDGSNAESGSRVAAVGDMNGDGFADIVIGASQADVPEDESGKAYVIFGSDDPTAWSAGMYSLGALDNGIRGFSLRGNTEGDQVGSSVACAGDINGDGLSDLLVSAHGAIPGGSFSGKTAVLFGSNAPDAWSAGVFSLSALTDGNRGALFIGKAGDQAGVSVSSAGDVNGDEIVDFLVGADGARPTGGYSGRTNVIFGSNATGALSEGTFYLESLSDSIRGFALNGEESYDISGAAVSRAGDINGDGRDDFVVGAPGNFGGKSYVIFGLSPGVTPTHTPTASPILALTTRTPIPTSTSARTPDSDNTALITGLVLGGFGLVSLLYAAWYYCKRDYSKQQEVLTEKTAAPGDFAATAVPLDSVQPTSNQWEFEWHDQSIKGAESSLVKQRLSVQNQETKPFNDIFASIGSDVAQTSTTSDALDSRLTTVPDVVVPRQLMTNSDLSQTYLADSIEQKAVLSLPVSGKMASLTAPGQLPGRPSLISKTTDSPTRVTGSIGEMTLSFSIAYKDLELEQKLGEGAYGTVFKGQWDFNPVAIKRLHAKHFSESALAEFKQEARIMAKMRSDYLVVLKGLCFEAPHYCLVMELMPRGSLYGLLKNNPKLPWSVRYRIGLDVIYGLYHLHKENILHRDLKSLNVLLDDTLRAKVCDFGLAKMKSEVGSMTSTKSTKGTLGWMSPECFDDEPTSKAGDLYAYGMVLWEMVMRPYRIPFQGLAPAKVIGQKMRRGANQETLPKDCPSKLAGLIKRCWDLAKQRPSAKEAAAQLKPLYEEALRMERVGMGASAVIPVAASALAAPAAGVAASSSSAVPSYDAGRSAGQSELVFQ